VLGLGRGAAIFDYLDRSRVHNLHVNEHLEGRHNRRLLIWLLLCLEEWCDVFLAGSSPERGSAGRSHAVAHGS
jgi:hypothetical protein